MKITNKTCFTGFSGVLCGLVLTAFAASMFPAPLSAEQITMTTSYPAPHAGYTNLVVSNDAMLAKLGGSIVVGTGTTVDRLLVSGSAGFTSSLDVNSLTVGGMSRVAGLFKVTNGPTRANASLTVDGELTASNVFIGPNAVLTRINCVDPGIINSYHMVCSQRGTDFRVRYNECDKTSTCNAPAPACDSVSYGANNCGDYCQKAGPPCCVARTCSAANPACGKTTTGVDNCGKPCTRTGPVCVCVPYGCCHVSRLPARGKYATGTNSCGKSCRCTGRNCCL